MYSVEDLLISHGYKLPRSDPPPVPVPVLAPPAAATPYDKRPAEAHRELVDNRALRGTLNGNEVDRGTSSVTGVYGTTRQALVKAYPVPDNEGAERIQRRKEAGVGILSDAQPLGDSLATDSGFYDVPSLTYSEPLSHDERDLSYWRRRGQDFSILLDYADGRELRASAGAWRPQALITAEEYRAERQAQQLWEDLSWLRDPDAGPGQLRVTGERKCQSLGTEDWRPAVGLGRQLSDGDGERWARDHYRLRTPEGFFHPRTKTKSQSLPRVLSPDGMSGRELIPSRPSLPDRQRLNSTVFSGPYSRYVYGGVRDRWARNSGPSSHVALLPKPRFSRPLKPPSYEIHQQTRGSAEMLAIDHGAKHRERSIYYSRAADLRHDYFAHHSSLTGMEPPGYIPPPSYRRIPPPRAVTFNRNEMANLRWRAETLQMTSSDPGRWLSRHSSGSWLEYYGERVASYRKQIQSGPEEQPAHNRQLPAEEPRVQQISGGPSGASLTDSEKILNIKEILPAKTLGQSTIDSAFPTQQGPALNTETRKAAPSSEDSSNRWCNKVINKKSNSVGPEQSRSQFLPSSILGKPPPPPCKLPDQGVSEIVPEVKKVEVPEPPEKEKTKNLKKRLSETIFCLVSVPATPQLTGTIIRDQNNNNEKSPDPAGSPSDNKTGHLTNQSLQSTSSAEAELQALTGSFASSKTSSRASSKMFKKLPCRPPKINHYKELKLSGTWPANQYRDQETQTSPETQTPGSEIKEAQEPIPGTEVAKDGSSLVGNTFTFPLQGVKSLKLSSNSAFSLTSTFSSQMTKSASQLQTIPTSGNAEETKSAENDEQDAFEQIRIKPIAQRPWDAVKELEIIQKEIQDGQQQKNKQPSVDKCIEDLNEAYKDILELGTASNKVSNGTVQIPERIKIRLTSEPLNKPSSLRRSAVSWSVDPEYREIKSAFSRPATKSVTFSKHLREELPVPPRETGFREYRVVAHLSRRRSNDGRTVKLDLPDEPIETPLCDFSPTTRTAAAEVPWADRQPMQDASTLTSPPDYEDICQSLRQSKDPSDTRPSTSLSRSNESELLQDFSADSEEDCPICKRELENQMRQGPLPPLHEENSSDSSANQNGSPPQRAALASPAEPVKTEEPCNPGLDQTGFDQSDQVNEQHLKREGCCEKSVDCQTEDFENTCTANPLESIPANEATKDLSPTSLASAGDPPTEAQVAEDHGTTGTETTEVELENQKAVEGETPESTTSQNTSETVGSDGEPTNEKQEQEKKTFVASELRIGLRTLGREAPVLPEFPPDRLPLSVPPHLDRRLSLSLEGERRTKGPSQRIEALQNKLAISPGRVAVERLARMREVDVICRVRRLSIRSTDSGDGDGEDNLSRELELEHHGDKENNHESTHSQQVAEGTVVQDEKKSSLSEPQ